MSALLMAMLSALSVGVVHTLYGPDHYLPFIVLAKSRHWSMLKTAIITLLCGIGHVLSAAVLGVFAVGIGITLNKVKFIEAYRSDIAAWLLVGFGFAYFVWGIHNIIKNKKHSHLHLHVDGSEHIHTHNHNEEHAHVHAKKSLKEVTPWILFIIFVFGPCEPLIPLIMYPSIQKSVLNTIWITLFFSIGTLFTMLFMVLTTVYGTNKVIKFDFFERYGNAMAGMIICGCGLAIKFLGI